LKNAFKDDFRYIKIKKNAKYGGGKLLDKCRKFAPFSQTHFTKTIFMFYIIGIVITFFLAFLLISKKDKSLADKILATWLILIGIHLSFYYLYTISQIYQYPFLLGFEAPIPYLQGVFLYLYSVFVTKQMRTKPEYYFFHFIPPLLIYFYLIHFFILPNEYKIYVYQNKGIGYETFSSLMFLVNSMSGVVYIVLSLIVLKRHRVSILNEFSQIEKINFRWLQYLIYGMCGIWFLVIFSHSDFFIFSGVVFFVLFLGYFGIKQVGLFTNIQPHLDAVKLENATEYLENTIEEDDLTDFGSPVKYQKSGLTKDVALDIHEALIHVVDKQKIYKDAELTLSSLASHLDIHPNYLSQVINQVEEKNFYDYINLKRVEEFKKLVAQPDSQKYTLLALAYDCGFNSKTSFNRNFKKATGLSPSEYLKEVKVHLN
jgi:AraC-like DNA-binding protein